MSIFHRIYRFFSQCYPPPSKFDIDRDIPDLSGKVVIVTGGNTGIGYQTIKALLAKNAKVYMASRSREKAEAAIAKLKHETGKQALFLELDLASLDKVTRAAQEFKSKERELHILFNSGGVMTPPIDLLTEDGFDLQFGTNVLGHAHFTLSLIPELQAGAKSSPDSKARVVNTTSLVVYLHPMTPRIKFESLRDGPGRKAIGTRNLYSQSKFGVIAFSNELAKRYADYGITSNAVNPGNLDSDLQRHMSALQKWMTDLLFSHPVQLGALTQLYVGTSSETVDANGQMFIPWARPYYHEPETHDPRVEAELWEWIEEQRVGH
ncbi:hypothetical protein FRB94_010995 [Tulasnella sp. JGI-2019a]|nr:hypothetical protein FRB93_000566 [Tulasnella sp. JGI-2019a]KAG9010018.1 hypothetical protein FRB94_010995 [Tulasnella sp. JGI-2019a]KAG9028763.1 hypothetical protein FRB95_006090 [Tulasnella sp. JGI-2019a]